MPWPWRLINQSGASAARDTATIGRQGQTARQQRVGRARAVDSQAQGLGCRAGGIDQGVLRPRNACDAQNDRPAGRRSSERTTCLP